MKTERFKSFNYAIGMFGTSIPINHSKPMPQFIMLTNLG